MRRTTPAILLLAALGCGGNPYGYARYYIPFGEEDTYAAAAIEPPYTDVVRDPGAFADETLGWFGVVREVLPQDDGSVLVRMSQRPHVERHLCSARSEDSCRVTVSERDAGPFSVRLRLRPGPDSEGENRVQWESLLKIYGRPGGDYDSTGGPLLDVDYYRHWPRGQYVDTTASPVMRR
ncbi:MAG: hypothetical protein HY907_10945 [Deltaproteobacteria bacterium]|nr:hypothetical protein [Deltaproteobacteria bacterium]